MILDVFALRCFVLARFNRALRPLLLLAAMPAPPPIPAVPIDSVGSIVAPPAAIDAAHRFGVSVAIADDRLVVGADGRRDGPPDAGAVVVYRRTDDALARWRLDRVIRAPDGGAGDAFGAAVALDGDRLVVGGPDHDDRRGAVWLIRLDAPDTPPRRLEIPDLAPGDQVGECVAIAGDLVVIGAPRANRDGCLDRGRVWCVRLDAASDRHAIHELEPPVAMTGLRFGTSIAIGPSIAVGAPGADVPADPRTPETIVDRAGEVVRFARRSPFERLGVQRRSDPGPLDRTGTAVAWCDDLLTAGSPRADCGSGRGGLVTVFGRPPAERRRPCRPDGGTGGRISIGGTRLATPVPGRRGSDGRLDGSILIGRVGADGVVPELELVSIAPGPLLFDVDLNSNGSRLAVGAARDHEDESSPGVVRVVEFTVAPVPAVADETGDDPSGG